MFVMDSDDASAVLGYISGFSASLETDKRISSVVNYIWGELHPKFDLFLDELARTDNDSFMHVYEWGSSYSENAMEIGNPEARLWRQTLRGRGRNKIASFEFLPSMKPVPVDPILLEPGMNGRSVKEGVHIFYMKATVMELGAEITVSPTLAHYLAYVSGANRSGGVDHRPMGTNKEGSVSFSKGPVIFTAGGGHTTGKFTGAFEGWWNEYAPAILAGEISPTLENDLREDANMMSLLRTRTKSFSITPGSGEGYASFERGRVKAEEIALRRVAKYTARAEASRGSDLRYDINEL